MRFIRHIVLGLAFWSAVGGASYDQVTDPTTGKIYYTTNDKFKHSDSGSHVVHRLPHRRPGHPPEHPGFQHHPSSRFENGKNGFHGVPQVVF